MAFAHTAGSRPTSYCNGLDGVAPFPGNYIKENDMKWSTPKVIEVCIGMEINDYFPAEL